MSPGLERHEIHPALYKPVLFAGLTESMAVMVFVFGAVGVYTFGWNLVTPLFLALLAGLSALLARAVAADPEIEGVFVRSVRYADEFDPVPGLTAPSVPTHPSLPRR